MTEILWTRSIQKAGSSSKEELPIYLFLFFFMPYFYLHSLEVTEYLHEVFLDTFVSDTWTSVIIYEAWLNQDLVTN